MGKTLVLGMGNTYYTVKIAEGDMYKEGLTKEVEDAVPKILHFIQEEI